MSIRFHECICTDKHLAYVDRACPVHGDGQRPRSKHDHDVVLDKWEYMDQTHYSNVWNDYGQEGWELVSVTQDSSGYINGYFKRKVG